MPLSMLVRTSAILLLSVGVAFGQIQFVEQSGGLPGPVVWSEGIETIDANGDGWPDLIVSNGMGFSSAQGALAPTLLINQAMAGAAVFADETSGPTGRIPAGFTQQGKALTVADVDGDGDEDIVFANAFQNQPRLLINDGTGFFTDQTGARLPSMSLSSFGVAAGDLDDDGDLDLVLSDLGASMNGPGAKARLLINDGTGVFTDAPAKMNAVNKPGAMQVSLVDVDGDLDLDVIVDGKSSGQQLYVNDGDANFTFDGTSLPAGGGSVYETDWADLDADGDVDGVYISMSGFNEGTATNDLAGGVIGFTGMTTTFNGLNGNDDNEAAFLDANNDGLLDVLIASLGNNREKLYLNAGTLAAGSLVYQSNGFTATSDSTLDLAIADFDQDGAYDVATAQGESGSFLNRLYLNTGPADSFAPSIAVVTPAPATYLIDDFTSEGFVVRARIQDATYDSGRMFASASMSVLYVKGAFSTASNVPMSYIGGGLWRGVIPAPVSPVGLAGMDVTFDVTALDPAGNSTTTAPQTFRVCGMEGYGTTGGVNDVSLTSSSVPAIGAALTFDVTQAPASQAGVLAVSGASGQFAALGGDVLIDVASPPAVVPFGTDGSGAAAIALSIPANPIALGFSAFLQAFVYDPSKPFDYAFSSGLQLTVCDYLAGPPQLTTVAPFAGATGDMITLTGEGFDAAAVVEVGGIAATVTSVTANQIVFMIPAGIPCDTSVTVRNPDGQNASLPFNPSPLISMTLFPMGTAAGGELFIISGQFFAPGTAVTIGGTPAMITFQSDISIVTTTPPGVPGAATVVVGAPGGCTVTTTYTYF